MTLRAWTPPDGLNRSRPREVRLRRGGRALACVGVGLWLAALVAGVSLEVEARAQAERQRVFREHAVHANGEVTRLWRRRGESRQTWIAYRFSAGGRDYARQVRVPPATWQALGVGSSVPIRYLPSNPGVNFLAGTGPGRSPVLLPYLVAAALAVGGALVLLPLRIQRRLLAEGRAAQGRVTRHKRGQHGTSARFEFVALSGSRFEGETGPRFRLPPVGSLVCVLYDPDHPPRSALYPFSLVVPANRRGL